MNNAKYCQECFDGRYRLCTRCKVPYPDAKYFDASNSNRCNSCHKKYVKEREKREQQKKQEPVSRNIQPERPPIKRRVSTSSDSDDSGEESVRVLQTLLLQALKNEKVLREKRKRKKKMKKMSNELLRTIYYDPSHPASFGSIISLYKAGRALDPSLTYSRVKRWLQRQDVYSLHGRLRKRFKRRKTIASGLNYQLQMDLVDLDSIKGYNHNSRYLLTAINVFSRKAYVQPLRNKNHTSVLRALDKVFASCPYPKYLQTDQGLEFLSAPIKNYLRERNIRHFYTSSDTKCSIVERFNRTLKGRMFKYFTANQTLHYLDVLPQIVEAYNNRVHRSIGIAPNLVTLRNEQDVWNYQYKSYLKLGKAVKYSFQIGDIVRLSKLHRTFRKGYLPTFNDEYFTVHTHLGTTPATYKLIDQSGNVLVGVFYREELQRVIPVKGQYTVLQRRKKKGQAESLVHITGRPAEQREWIPNRVLKRTDHLMPGSKFHSPA